MQPLHIQESHPSLRNSAIVNACLVHVGCQSVDWPSFKGSVSLINLIKSCWQFHVNETSRPWCSKKMADLIVIGPWIFETCFCFLILYLELVHSVLFGQTRSEIASCLAGLYIKKWNAGHATTPPVRQQSPLSLRGWCACQGHTESEARHLVWKPFPESQKNVTHNSHSIMLNRKYLINRGNHLFLWEDTV